MLLITAAHGFQRRSRSRFGEERTVITERVRPTFAERMGTLFPDIGSGHRCHVSGVRHALGTSGQRSSGLAYTSFEYRMASMTWRSSLH